MEDKYAALSSISVTGKQVSEIGSVTGGVASSVESTFSLNLARPDFYRIEWREAAQTAYNAGAVWSTGAGHFVLSGRKVTQYPERGLALGVGGVHSRDVAKTVPTIFFHDTMDKMLGWLTHLKNPARQPDERIDTEDCYVVAADGLAGKTVVWITKRNFLMKQFRTTTGGDLQAKVSQAVSVIGDESLKAILERSGKAVTSEAIRKLRAEMEESGRVAAQSRTSFTQTCQSIVVNKAVKTEEFEATLPPGVATPPAKQPEPPHFGIERPAALASLAAHFQKRIKHLHHEHLRESLPQAPQRHVARPRRQGQPRR